MAHDQPGQIFGIYIKKFAQEKENEVVEEYYHEVCTMIVRIQLQPQVWYTE